jgi:hypothetical protein
VDRAERAQQLLLVGLADNVDERHPVGDTELDEHLAKIRRRGRVHHAGMTFAAHGFEHSESSQRIDERRRPVRRRCPRRQNQTRGSINHSVLRIHPTASNSHRFPQQSLRR